MTSSQRSEAEHEYKATRELLRIKDSQNSLKRKGIKCPDEMAIVRKLYWTITETPTFSSSLKLRRIG